MAFKARGLLYSNMLMKLVKMISVYLLSFP